jgi:hypothetical protein
VRRQTGICDHVKGLAQVGRNGIGGGSKGRDEIRGIYVAELNARGLAAPREDVLDAAVERITGNPLPAARLAVEGLAQMGKALNELSRLFRSGS